MQIFKKYGMALLIAVLVSAAAVMIYVKLHPQTLARNLVEGSGRIDGDMINLNLKYPGRVESIFKETGDAVDINETVAVIASEEYRAKLQQIEAQIDAGKGELEARRVELSIARKTLPQSVLKAQANVVIKQRQMDELDETIDAQKSVALQSAQDAARMKNLFDNRLIEKRQVEMAQLKAKTDEDQLTALHQKRSQLEKALSISKSDQVEADAAQLKISVLEHGIDALESNLKALDASKKEVGAVLGEMKILSPIRGYVIEKIANPGEVIGSGMPVAALIDPNTLYLKVFVDTLQNGKIKMGDRAVIFLDAAPDEPIPARVVRIEQKAEFTPKEVSVPSDRVQRVFAVHLKPERPDGKLKLGIPAVGVITLDGKGLPASLREVPE